MFEFVSRTERPVTAAVLTAVVLLTCYCICKCLYILYLHPLSKFPGPKLAAIGSLYEFYYDVIKDGQYIWEIERMHRKYGKNQSSTTPDMSEARIDGFLPGPIVRINSRELHIRDSHYYSNIYAGGSRRVNKDATNVRAFAVPTSAAATVDHDHHRVRRGYLNPYFSKRSIISLEPVIHERIGRLCMRLEEAMHQGQVICLDSAFSALAADIITQRFYGEHLDYLGIKDFKFAESEAFAKGSLTYHLVRFIPGFVTTVKSMAIPVVRMILPGVADLLVVQENMKHRIFASLDRESTMKTKSVIIWALKDPNIPVEERRIDRLLDECSVITFGGTETSSRALGVGMFYVLNDKSLMRKLRDELDTLPSRPDHAYSLSELEPLPFLVSFPANHQWSSTRTLLT